MDIDNEILSYALQNALKYNGKANEGAVIGKVLSSHPEFKSDIDEIKAKIRECVNKVNSMKTEEQTALLQELNPEALEKKKKEHKKELPPLKNAEEGKVVTRIPPEPSKYNHIGHALSFLINYFYAKKYNGRCVLRFEDTNPEKGSQEFVDAMLDDIHNYLKIRPDSTVYASDDLPKMYQLAERMIKEKNAYVCFCKREGMQKLRHDGSECRCRSNSVDKNLVEWRKMLERKYKSGDCVLRLKGDMQAFNHVMRDPVLFRIIFIPHYRQGDKYCVWATYDLENAVEDSMCGVTHILRSSEFGKMRNELQSHLKSILGMQQQTIIHYGRFNITGGTTKGREIREGIASGLYKGWDDPRLVTLKALKRRGILAEAIHELVYHVGLSLTETNLDFSILAAINRKIIDPVARRYFFIREPVPVRIEGAPSQDIQLKSHPDHAEYGVRDLKSHNDFYISRQDFERFENGKLYRLMDCLNFKKTDKKFMFDSREYEKYKKVGEMIIHWLPRECKPVEVSVVMPDATAVSGYGEPLMRNIKVGEVIQAERFGFMRLDEKTDNKMIFWYTHD